MTELAALPSRTLPPQPVEPPAAPASSPTRCGELAVSPERLIAVRSGVLGQRYALADLPDPQVVFKLLQSIDAPELAFLVLPLDPAAGPIGRSDLERACRELGFDWHTLVVLGIVTIRSDPEGVRFSINLKAPLLIDSRCQVGRQHVFASEVYPLRHDLPRAHAA